MMKDGDKAELHGRGERKGRTKPPVEKEEEEEEDNPKSSICCLQGCLAATAVGFSFFVALPTGILLVVYATKKDDVPLLSVGAVLISLPVVMLVVVIALCFNQRRLARLGKNRVTIAAIATKATASHKKQKLASSSSSWSRSSSSSLPPLPPPTVMTVPTVTPMVTEASQRCAEGGKPSEVAGGETREGTLAGWEKGWY